MHDENNPDNQQEQQEEADQEMENNEAEPVTENNAPVLETQPSNVLETQESNKPRSRSSSRSRSASPVKSHKSDKSRSPSPAEKSNKSEESPVAKSGYDGTPIKEDKKITDFISTCHIRNLSRNCTEEHLEEIFGVYGKILKIQRDKDGPPRSNLGVDKLHCFIDFESLEVAEKVIEHMDRGIIDNNQIEVVIQKGGGKFE